MARRCCWRGDGLNQLFCGQEGGRVSMAGGISWQRMSSPQEQNVVVAIIFILSRLEIIILMLSHPINLTVLPIPFQMRFSDPSVWSRPTQE